MPERDPLELLREQIRAATEAAERLAVDAGARRTTGGGAAKPAPGAGDVPPSGWASATGSEHEAASEIQALAALLATLRELLPPELQEQITAVIHQLLILLRALIDWAVSRVERGARGAEVVVEDIPIS